MVVFDESALPPSMENPPIAWGVFCCALKLFPRPASSKESLLRLESSGDVLGQRKRYLGNHGGGHLPLS